MAEDSVPPLPRRAPGDSGRPKPEPATRVALPRPLVQRILETLEAAGTQASPGEDQAALSEPAAQDHAIPPERPAVLHHQAPEASTSSEMPAQSPVPAIALPRQDPATESIPAVSRFGAETEKTRPNIIAPPRSVLIPPGQRTPTSPLRTSPDRPPDGHARRDGEVASREETPARPKETPTRPKETPTSREE
jgi:hypothetical protein